MNFNVLSTDLGFAAFMKLSHTFSKTKFSYRYICLQSSGESNICRFYFRKRIHGDSIFGVHPDRKDGHHGVFQYDISLYAWTISNQP